MQTQYLRKEKLKNMEADQNHRITRRGRLHVGSAALAGVQSYIAVANAQDTGGPPRESQTIGRLSDRPDHHLKNETVRGPKNPTLAHRCDSQRRDGDHPDMRLWPCRLGVTRLTGPPRTFPIRSQHFSYLTACSNGPRRAYSTVAISR